MAHIALALHRSGEDGRWQWSYSSWNENGASDDLEHTYRADMGCGDCSWPANGLTALLHRICLDASDLAHPEPF